MSDGSREKRLSRPRRTIQQNALRLLDAQRFEQLRMLEGLSGTFSTFMRLTMGSTFDGMIFAILPECAWRATRVFGFNLSMGMLSSMSTTLSESCELS